jgi:hypothetical protein
MAKTNEEKQAGHRRKMKNGGFTARLIMVKKANPNHCGREKSLYVTQKPSRNIPAKPRKSAATSQKTQKNADSGSPVDFCRELDKSVPGRAATPRAPVPLHLSGRFLPIAVPYLWRFAISPPVEVAVFRLNVECIMSIAARHCVDWSLAVWFLNEGSQRRSMGR